MGILTSFLKELTNTTDAPATLSPGKRVLNVGGNNKMIPIPEYFSGWQHDLLDIDPRGNPDIVCDAREMETLPHGVYDAVYCSHNLEHYHRHEGYRVIKGFLHVLKDNGFAEIRVPDIGQVIKAVVDHGFDIDEQLYLSVAGPITAHDILYGWQTEIERSGQDFYAHKTGFTPKSLEKALLDGGFQTVYLCSDSSVGLYAVHALAFKTEPTDEQRDLLGLPS